MFLNNLYVYALFFPNLASLGSDSFGNSLGTFCKTNFFKLHALKMLVFFEVWGKNILLLLTLYRKSSIMMI